jgi:hypothetical protein
MEIVIFAIVVIAALFAIGSGVWVATALVRAISRHRTAQTECRQPQSDANGPDV